MARTVHTEMAYDPFEMLGLPRRFGLGAGEIERAYLARAAEVHPDAGAFDRAGVTAADLNRARQDLKDPESRANILLELLGGPSKEADRSLPDGFLMEMMEVREEMEQGGGREDRSRWDNWAEQRRSGHEREVGALFDRIADLSADNPRTLAAIRTRLNAWRYIERMIEQINEGPGAI